MVAASELRSFETGLQSALTAIDAAIEAQAFAEDLPFVGDALKDTEAAELLEDVRGVLVFALQTLDDPLGHSLSDISDAMQDALATLGYSVPVTAQETADGFTVSFDLVQSATAQAALEADLGLPGLAIGVAGTADLSAGLTLGLTVGMDATGFFVDTSNDALSLEATADNFDFGATASLGPLTFAASDAGSSLGGTMSIDLSDNDGKLRVGETVSLAANLTANASLDIDLAAEFGSSALPSVSAGLKVDWDFVDATVTPYDQNLSFGELPSITLVDLTLDLGTFLENVVLPVLDAIGPLIEPVQIALDILTTDLEMLKLLPDWQTLLDKNSDGQITMLDLLQLADASLDLQPIEAFIELAAAVVDWANILDGMNLGEAGLNFGDFVLSGEDLRDPAFDIATAIVAEAGNGSDLGEAAGAITGGDWDNGGLDILQEMIDNTAFSLPILQDPGEVVSLLFGGDADLIEIDFPQVTLSAGSDTLVNIPVFPGINFVIGGGIGFAFDLGFGYSTRGLTQPGASLATALNGLYILDADGPEASLSATISVGAALDAVVASIVGSGDITGTIDLELADDLQSEQGRLYYDEFLSAIGTNPFSLFEASGSITAGLSLAAKVLGGDIFRLDSPRVTLAGFSFDGRAEISDGPDPLTLAGFSGNILTLNTGARAGERLAGLVEDSLFPRPVDADEVVNVSASATPGQVHVNIDGFAADYAHGSRIDADAGIGNDQVVLAEALAVSASLAGGAGDDVLAGGALGDTLAGGLGNDTLFGRVGDDSLSGDDGDDLFYGGAGADTIAGGVGDDMVSYVLSGSGVNVNLATGSGTSGTAQGDSLSGIEILQGSNHNDTLVGGATEEMIIGLEGNDSINGGGWKRPSARVGGQRHA